MYVAPTGGHVGAAASGLCFPLRLDTRVGVRRRLAAPLRCVAAAAARTHGALTSALQPPATRRPPRESQLLVRPQVAQESQFLRGEIHVPADGDRGRVPGAIAPHGRRDQESNTHEAVGVAGHRHDVVVAQAQQRVKRVGDLPRMRSRACGVGQVRLSRVAAKRPLPPEMSPLVSPATNSIASRTKRPIIARAVTGNRSSSPRTNSRNDSPGSKSELLVIGAIAMSSNRSRTKTWALRSSLAAECSGNEGIGAEMWCGVSSPWSIGSGAFVLSALAKRCTARAPYRSRRASGRPGAGTPRRRAST